MAMETTAEHEILILVAAMIAQGRPHFSEANITTMVKQATIARDQIYEVVGRGKIVNNNPVVNGLFDKKPVIEVAP